MVTRYGVAGARCRPRYADAAAIAAAIAAVHQVIRVHVAIRGERRACAMCI